ncbi:TIGR04255 family protein [Mycolicibacter sinensis]
MTSASHHAPTTADIPLGGLPPADPTLLIQAPLEVAVVEVRFSAAAADISASDAMTVRDALVQGTGKDYPGIQPALQHQVQIDLGSDGLSRIQQQSKGWQIAAADGAVHVTLMPDVVIMQISAYERWSTSIKAPLGVLLETLDRLVEPSLVHRIGLRYVDRFEHTDCGSVAAWKGRIDDTLLGPVLNPVFGGKVRSAQQQVEIRLDDHHGALLRHGPVHGDSGKTVQYLLDTDVFRHSTSEFNPAEVLYAAERLNRTALSLFQASMTADYLRQLRDGTAQ